MYITHLNTGSPLRSSLFLDSLFCDHGFEDRYFVIAIITYTPADDTQIYMAMTQIKSLTDKVAALTECQSASAAAVEGSARPHNTDRRTYNSTDRREDGARQNHERGYNNGGQRSYRPTPQRTQLQNHDRLQETRATQQQIADISDTQRTQDRPVQACTNCGRLHANRDDCRAQNLHCFNCQRIGHLSAYCRGVRTQQRETGGPAAERCCSSRR